MVFCISVDRNGYVATHNRSTAASRSAATWPGTPRNSRYRRIFNDRTGLASARNQRPFLLQTYRRDMGSSGTEGQRHELREHLFASPSPFCSRLIMAL